MEFISIIPRDCMYLKANHQLALYQLENTERLVIQRLINLADLAMCFKKDVVMVAENSSWKIEEFILKPYILLDTSFTKILFSSLLILEFLYGSMNAAKLEAMHRLAEQHAKVNDENCKYNEFLTKPTTLNNRMQYASKEFNLITKNFHKLSRGFIPKELCPTSMKTMKTMEPAVASMVHTMVDSYNVSRYLSAECTRKVHATQYRLFQKWML